MLQLVANLLGRDGAPAESENARHAPFEREQRALHLLRAELLEAALANGLRRSLIQVVAGTPEALGNRPDERRLPRTHEPDERDVPVERVQGHAIRSM